MALHTIQLQYFIFDIQAENNDGVHAAVSGNSTLQTISTGITNPKHPRNIRVVSTGTHGGTCSITGIDAKGSSLTEEITIVPGDAASGNQAFSIISSFTVPAALDATDTISLGFGSKLGVPNYIIHASHVRRVLKNGSIISSSKYTASAGYSTVDLSRDDAIVDGDDYEIVYSTF